MLTHITPDSIRAPFARYSHGVLVETGTRLLFCSGQLGISPDDHVPADAARQSALCFENIRAVLTQARLGPRDVVRVNAYVTSRAYLPDYMCARDAFFEDVDPPPASTLMVVSGFARIEFKVEIEVVAAQGRSEASS